MEKDFLAGANYFLLFKGFSPFVETVTEIIGNQFLRKDQILKTIF